MKENLLVKIEYLALNNHGEECAPQVVNYKRGKVYDKYKVLVEDYKYELHKLEFTSLFQNLNREARKKIYDYIFKVVSTGELVKNKKVDDYYLRFEFNADDFIKKKVIKWEECFVRVENYIFIDTLKRYLGAVFANGDNLLRD